jgi:hypothetical protein
MAMKVVGSIRVGDMSLARYRPGPGCRVVPADFSAWLRLILIQPLDTKDKESPIKARGAFANLLLSNDPQDHKGARPESLHTLLSLEERE